MCALQHLRTNLILGSEKQPLKVKNFEVVNSTTCAIFTPCHCKNLASGRSRDFPPENFYFEIFSKTNVVSITSGPKYKQSLKEIDFPTETQWTGFRESPSFKVIPCFMSWQTVFRILA